MCCSGHVECNFDNTVRKIPVEIQVCLIIVQKRWKINCSKFFPWSFFPLFNQITVSTPLQFVLSKTLKNSSKVPKKSQKSFIFLTSSFSQSFDLDSGNAFRQLCQKLYAQYPLFPLKDRKRSNKYSCVLKKSKNVPLDPSATVLKNLASMFR